ncbi:DUF7481 family protein [Myxococcus landrumensis]|uniref:DUF7481 domain-containing protein n=1 Tax=Myxococcus landrumensis TaxID=2813577 RepID=A0ABX7NDU1_9BACT|nr:hypothetical protein [Myxococcus landrumus]QSQ16558.1 hypothetical protein JY572_11150 [Myxococcus landrumus]
MRCIYTGLVLAVLWGTGCGGTKDSDDDNNPGPGGEPGGTINLADFYKSGSRIKAQVTTTTDGLRWPDEWHDSKLKKPCTWETAGADGALYCVPGGMEYIPNGGSGYYFDASCTEGIVVTSEPVAATDFFVKRSTGCGVNPRYHTVGAEITTSVYAKSSSGTCSSIPVSTGFKAYRPGPEVAAGTFVRATVKQKQTDKGVTVHFMEGEDGSAQFHHVQDTARNTECAIQKASDNKLRCLPSGATTASGNAAIASVNSTCTEPAFYSTCGTPEFAVTFEQDRCGPGAKVYATGAKVTQIYGTTGTGSCQAHPQTPPNFTYYRAGAEIAAASFVEAKELDIKTFGRLKVRGAGMGDKVQIPMMLHDTQLNTPCAFMKDSAGAKRCFPTSSIFSTGTLFADDACKNPVGLANTTTCTPDRYVLANDVSNPSDTTYRAYNVGQQFNGTVYVSMVFGTGAPRCMQTERIPGSTYYTLGSEIAAASLVLGTTKVE